MKILIFELLAQLFRIPKFITRKVDKLNIKKTKTKTFGLQSHQIWIAELTQDQQK